MNKEKFKTLYYNPINTELIHKNNEENEYIHSGDGFIYTINKNTAYKYVKVLRNGGSILVNRNGNNKIINGGLKNEKI